MDKKVVLEATPNADNLFIGWSGDCSGSKSRIFVTMDAAKNCTATFNTKPSGPLTLSVDKIGDGQAIVKGRLKGEDKTIYCTSGCQQASYDYQAGDQVILTANPKDGFIFTEWGGDCSGTDASITVLMDQAKHCTAQIDRDPAVPMYKLEVVIKSLVNGNPLSSLGTALIDKPGQIDCSQSGETCTAAYYKADEKVRLTALSTRFIDFIEWGGDCGDSGANKRASIMLTADMRCEAIFKDQFELYAEDLLEDFYTHATLANGDSVDSLFPRGDSNDARIKEAFWLSALTMIYVDQYLNLNNLTAWPDQFDALEWLPNSDRIEYTDSLQIIANGTFIGIKVRLIDTVGQEEIVGIVLYYDEEPPVLDEGSWFRAISSAAFFSRYAFR
ncbi:conserved hypothetical protein [Beggiatoa sp. PS]|nr:conserved hypothetical protein [Beggiatoa sp. PS]